MSCLRVWESPLRASSGDELLRVLNLSTVGRTDFWKHALARRSLSAVVVLEMLREQLESSWRACGCMGRCLGQAESMVTLSVPDLGDCDKTEDWNLRMFACISI